MEDSSLEYLSQLKNEQKSETFNQIVDRMIAENDLRKFFNELKEYNFKVHENVDLSIDFDFSIRKSDVEIIGVIEYQTHFRISIDKVKELNRILSSTIRSEGIVLVFAIKPDYPSVLLSFSDLNKMMDEGKNEFDLNQTKRPIREIIELYFKDPEPLISSAAPNEKYRQAEQLRIMETFDRFLREETEATKLRKYTLDYRLKAAEKLTEHDKKLMSSLFKMALDNKLEKITLERLLEEISKVDQL